jgi:rSAM/selenodomain-associated transferase 1
MCLALFKPEIIHGFGCLRHFFRKVFPTVSVVEFPDARILVFAKAPTPGKVKTRLIPRYGASGATALYRTLLRRTLADLQRARLSPVELWCAPNSRHSFFAACRRDYGVTLRVQRGADLGRRMDAGLTEALERGPYALVIGGDCIGLTPADIRQALAVLAEGRDAVIGPAEDGGYVLIGLRRPCPSLFRGIAWGGTGVLASTRRRLRQSGLRWAELPPRWDVDRPADVRRLRQRFDLRPYALPLSVSPKESVP